MTVLSLLVILVVTALAGLVTIGVAIGVGIDVARDLRELARLGVRNGRHRVAVAERRRTTVRGVLGGLGILWCAVAWHALSAIDLEQTLDVELVAVVVLFALPQAVLVYDTVADAVTRRRLTRSSIEAVAGWADGQHRYTHPERPDEENPR